MPNFKMASSEEWVANPTTERNTTENSTENCEDGEPEEIYEVEKIMGIQKINGEVKYKVRWAGYSPTWDTWEPIEHLDTCKDLIGVYEAEQRKKKMERKEAKRLSVEALKPDIPALVPEIPKVKDSFWDDLEAGKINVFDNDLYSKVKGQGRSARPSSFKNHFKSSPSSSATSPSVKEEPKKKKRKKSFDNVESKKKAKIKKSASSDSIEKGIERKVVCETAYEVDLPLKEELQQETSSSSCEPRSLDEPSETLPHSSDADGKMAEQTESSKNKEANKKNTSNVKKKLKKSREQDDIGRKSIKKKKKEEIICSASYVVSLDDLHVAECPEDRSRDKKSIGSKETAPPGVLVVDFVSKTSKRDEVSIRHISEENLIKDCDEIKNLDYSEMKESCSQESDNLDNCENIKLPDSLKDSDVRCSAENMTSEDNAVDDMNKTKHEDRSLFPIEDFKQTDASGSQNTSSTSKVKNERSAFSSFQIELLKPCSSASPVAHKQCMESCNSVSAVVSKQQVQSSDSGPVVATKQQAQSSDDVPVVAMKQTENSTFTEPKHSDFNRNFSVQGSALAQKIATENKPCAIVPPCSGRLTNEHIDKLNNRILSLCSKEKGSDAISTQKVGASTFSGFYSSNEDFDDILEVKADNQMNSNNSFGVTNYKALFSQQDSNPQETKIHSSGMPEQADAIEQDLLIEELLGGNPFNDVDVGQMNAVVEELNKLERGHPTPGAGDSFPAHQLGMPFTTAVPSHISQSYDNVHRSQIVSNSMTGIVSSGPPQNLPSPQLPSVPYQHSSYDSFSGVNKQEAYIPQYPQDRMTGMNPSNCNFNGNSTVPCQPLQPYAHQTAMPPYKMPQTTRNQELNGQRTFVNVAQNPYSIPTGHHLPYQPANSQMMEHHPMNNYVQQPSFYQTNNVPYPANGTHFPPPSLAPCGYGQPQQNMMAPPAQTHGRKAVGQAGHTKAKKAKPRKQFQNSKGFIEQGAAGNAHGHDPQGMYMLHPQKVANTKTPAGSFDDGFESDIQFEEYDISDCHKDWEAEWKTSIAGFEITNTQLKEAVKKGDYTTVSKALGARRKRYDLEQPDSTGMSLVMIAAQKGYDDILEVLVQNGAKINAQQKNGNSALMYAAEQGHICTVALMLASGAYVNLQQCNGETALMKAVKKGHRNVIKMLLENGVNFGHLSLNDNTALKMAKMFNHHNISDMINNFLSKLTSLFEEQVQITLNNTAEIATPVFPLQCFSLCESTTFRVNFKHELQPTETGVGMILFIAHARITPEEMRCRFYGPCAVKSVILNEVQQPALTEEANFVLSFSPLHNGLNQLVINTVHAPTTKAKLLVCAYRAALNTSQE